MTGNSGYVFKTRQGNDFAKVIRYKVRASVNDPYETGLLVGDVVTLYLTWPTVGAVSAGELEKPLSFDEDTGAIVVALTIAETRALPAGKYTSFEIELARGASTERTLLSGKFEVQRGINDD